MAPVSIKLTKAGKAALKKAPKKLTAAQKTARAKKRKAKFRRQQKVKKAVGKTLGVKGSRAKGKATKYAKLKGRKGSGYVSKYEYKAKPKSKGGKGVVKKTTPIHSVVKTKKGPTYVKYKKKSMAAGKFRSAFSAARKSGKKTFTWQGRRYSTKTK
jgi:DNA-binding protein HU-beta